METSYSELRCTSVVNVVDGRNLGRTCDVIFSFPEGKTFGIVVPGKKFRIFKNNGLFIPLKNIVKIGTDVVLVDLKTTPGSGCGPNKKQKGFCGFSPEQESRDRRSYDEYE